jgi:hypothetical protein
MIALVYLHISAFWAALIVHLIAVVICYNTAALKSVIICLGNDSRTLLHVLISLDSEMQSFKEGRMHLVYSLF